MKDKPFELSDRVYDTVFGWGSITNTEKPDRFKDYPQPFKYEVKFDSGEDMLYDINGKKIAAQSPTLFFKEPESSEKTHHFYPTEFHLNKTKKNGFDCFEIVGSMFIDGNEVKQKTNFESFDLDYLKFMFLRITKSLENVKE